MVRRGVRMLVLTAVTGALGCDVVSGLDDFAVVDDAAGGMGGGGGGAGGAGAAGPDLVGDGLIARYFLDEDFTGEPDLLIDASGRGLHLATFGTSNMRYTEDLGQRGLRWEMLGGFGRGEIAGLADVLDQTTTATVEVVMGLAGSPSLPRVFHVGGELDEGRFALVVGEGTLGLRVGLVPIARWSYDTTTRHVAHLRVDLAAPRPDERAVLFVDGQRRDGEPPAPMADATFDIPAGTFFVLGNRQNADRSPLGVIYYFALYSAALPANEIAANAKELLARDDHL